MRCFRNENMVIFASELRAFLNSPPPHPLKRFIVSESPFIYYYNVCVCVCDVQIDLREQERHQLWEEDEEEGC